MLMHEWGFWADNFFEAEEFANDDEPFPLSSQIFLLLSDSSLFGVKNLLMTYPPVFDPI